MPQTRYVLMRSLRVGLRPIVIVNKVDRKGAHPDIALDKTFDLFIELGADDEQADFPVLYGSGLDGWIVRDLEKDPREGMTALFETIVEKVPPPRVEADAPFRMQVSSLAWSDYVGRIGCGRVLQGSIRTGAEIERTVARWKDTGSGRDEWETVGSSPETVTHLWATRGLDRVEVDEAGAGDIVWLAGPAEINIGDTLSDAGLENPAMPPLEIEEPTVSMFFLVNNGPFAGKDGKAAMLPRIRERLDRELKTNVALRVEDVGRSDGLKVSGRGELHLAILIEEMRREGMELCVSRPEVITRTDADGKTLEPMELLVVEIPEESQGTVIEKLTRRKAEVRHMANHGTGVIRIEFEIPTRGLIGYRSDFLTDTRGLGIMSSRFTGYGPWRGEIEGRSRGSLVSMESGPATSYQIESLQERAVMFVQPMEMIYAGQVVGENSRPDDMPCNPTKKKHVTNHRSSTKDVAIKLKAHRTLTLDAALEWIAEDELVEVTPNHIRVRKAILDAESRKRARKLQLAMAG
jgi:GTP-binding protein